MLSTSVPIRREAGQGETITWAAEIQGEVVPSEVGPPEHLHARSDEGFLVVKRRHTGKDDRGLALVDDRSTARHRALAHVKSIFCTQAKNICHKKKQEKEHDKKILLLGRLEILLDDMEQQLRMPDIQLFDGTGIEDDRSVFA
jgi:hypothetical protein